LPQAAALASESGMPTIFEIHDLPQGSMGTLLFRAFLRGRGARRLVVITSALAQDLVRSFGIPAQPPFTAIAPDGVDLERYADLPEPVEARRRLLQMSSELTERALPPERFTAGYTGHLYAGRGVELLLELARRLPEMTFLLAGGEPQEVARLRSQTAAEGLDNVLLTGFIPNEKLPAYQAACEVLLMPYQRQVAASSGGDIARYLSPMKVFEYLACGRAILSSDLPVLRETLHAENAVLLPSHDVDAWALALQRLRDLPDERLRLAQRARQDAAQYTWEARASRIFDL
jgi:glycosyltransferase involved in cell wall biosynthesis